MNVVTIKGFGRNAKCHSPESLQVMLVERYINKPVAIIQTLKSGLNKTFFVTVRDDGRLVKTYNEAEEVPLSTFTF
ncbi:hypothetical protein GCM10007916_22640 [Psychromonas marina]|uniref:Uncharacterized protein n=1 Tax=Psychromonas marina TaxID=88364 RepID=A0ABQ6E1J3_9GAMM|nr:hypothetical protein [Psychromonas marina]GLS91195.1 hypothetical protein GCM10007916_22640 [Psychromonas marina]